VYANSAFPFIMLGLIWSGYPIKVFQRYMSRNPRGTGGQWRKDLFERYIHYSIVLMYLYVPSVTLAQFQVRLKWSSSLSQIQSVLTRLLHRVWTACSLTATSRSATSELTPPSIATRRRTKPLSTTTPFSFLYDLSHFHRDFTHSHSDSALQTRRFISPSSSHTWASCTG
jgi:hypothetical protein